MPNSWLLCFEIQQQNVTIEKIRNEKNWGAICFETPSPIIHFLCFLLLCFRAFISKHSTQKFSFLNIAQKHSNRKHKKWKKVTGCYVLKHSTKTKQEKIYKKLKIWGVMFWNVARKHFIFCVFYCYVFVLCFQT